MKRKSRKTDSSDALPDPGVLSFGSCIYVAGHTGMVGSAIVRHLRAAGYTRIVTRSRAELNLTDQGAVGDFFRGEKIDAVFLAAARVGGIHANNSYPAEFIYQNLMIQTNVIHEAYRAGVQRLLFLGSSCIYPKHAPQPMREEYLLSGYLEPTNEAYAVAKIVGIKLCEFYNRQYKTRYRSVMPTNLYGPNDNFDLESSHVLPALLRKLHLAKMARQGDWEGIKKDETRFGPLPAEIRADLTALAKSKDAAVSSAPAAARLWGSGNPRREFLHVDDAASACIYLMNLPDEQYDTARMASSSQPDRQTKTQAQISFINVGSGKDLTIKELAEKVKAAVGYRGEVVWDRTKPDGTPRKLMDVSRLTKLGWTPRVDLQAGIEHTYKWYRTQSAGMPISDQAEKTETLNV
jgi:GDP-L-fucose synthase